MIPQKIEGMIQAAESCGRFIMYLDQKYYLHDDDKEELQKLQYQLKNLNKNLKEMKEGF